MSPLNNSATTRASHLPNLLLLVLLVAGLSLAFLPTTSSLPSYNTCYPSGKAGYGPDDTTWGLCNDFTATRQAHIDYNNYPNPCPSYGVGGSSEPASAFGGHDHCPMGECPQSPIFGGDCRGKWVCTANCDGGGPTPCVHCGGCTVTPIWECAGVVVWWENQSVEEEVAFGLTEQNCPSPPLDQTVYPDTCVDKVWSLSSTILQTSAPCPVSTTCGQCAASVDNYLSCLSVLTDTTTGQPTGQYQLAPSAAACQGLQKPVFNPTVCDAQWSMTSTIGEAVSPASPSGTDCPNSSSACDTCSSNAQVQCVQTLSGNNLVHSTPSDDSVCGPKPQWKKVQCTYSWSASPTQYTPVSPPLTCPAAYYTSCGGFCDLQANLKCWETHPVLPRVPVDDSGCTNHSQPTPSYATPCSNVWSASASTYQAPPTPGSTACPTTNTCGVCPNDSQVTCVSVKPDNTFVAATAGQCAGAAPTYATNTCTYAWSTSSSTFVEAAQSIACPPASYSACGGACDLASELTCWQQYPDESRGPTSPEMCNSLPTPTYTTGCSNLWSASASTYQTPPTPGSTACPTTACGSCPSDSEVTCVWVKQGTTTFVAATAGQCGGTAPTYAPNTCSYQCRSGNTVVSCPSNGSDTCPCASPVSCTLTTTMECYNERLSDWGTGCLGSATHSYQGATNNSCDFQWSYSPDAPWDFTGLCPDLYCAQNCPTALPTTSPKCISVNGETPTVANDLDCTTAGLSKPTAYVPRQTCGWVCTANAESNTQVQCGTIIPPCTSCIDPASVSYTRTKCQNTDNGVIADAVNGWCGDNNDAAISVPRTCPTCSWHCRDPTNAAQEVSCSSITAQSYPDLAALQCGDCRTCTKSFDQNCFSTYLGGGFVDNNQCGAQPAAYTTTGISHQCSWQWLLPNHQTIVDQDDTRFKQLCPLADCQTCDQEIRQLCWDSTGSLLVADPTGQCAASPATATIAGLPNCPAPCTTCGWGCLAADGVTYKQCDADEFTKHCPVAGDVSCTCDITRSVQCVDYLTATATSTTTLAAQGVICDATSVPSTTFVFDRQPLCDVCSVSKPYWSGIDCSIQPKIESFDVAVVGSFRQASTNMASLDTSGQQLTYNDSVEFTWAYTGSASNIATIVMTSPSIAPLSTIIISSFLAQSNSFILDLSTLPFNTRLENVQFYASIGANVVRTPTLPTPVGFTISPRCASIPCVNNSLCDMETGVCNCDPASIWQLGSSCQTSVCSVLGCVASNVKVDPSSGDVCTLPLDNTSPKCTCKDDTFSGARCQNECVLNTVACPTETGRAQLRYTPSAADPDVSECSCKCTGFFSGSTCSTCGLNCMNGGRVSSSCSKCVCSTTMSSGYYWFGLQCSCRAFELSLTFSQVPPDLYAVLQSGYDVFSDAVNRVAEQADQAGKGEAENDTAVLTKEQRDIFSVTANGHMKAWMTSLLLSLLTDHYDTLIKMNQASGSTLFVRDSKEQAVLNADSITNAASIRSIKFVASSLVVSIVIVPGTCHGAGDTSPLNDDAWNPTKTVVNYLDQLLGLDKYTIALTDPDCVGTVCQSTELEPPSSPQPDESGASPTSATLSLLSILTLSLLFLLASLSPFE